jgi:hypothetical protein
MVKLLWRLGLLTLFVTIAASHLEAARRRPPQDVPEMNLSSATNALSALGLACALLRRRYRITLDGEPRLPRRNSPFR